MNKDEISVDLPMSPLDVTVCAVCGCEIDISGMPPLTKIECPDCESIETVPGRFGPFLVLGVIGAGGMGGVYRAKDESLGRLVAIKVILPSVAENRDFIETFKREAQSAAKLNHPHIAQIYSFGQFAGQPYIVMELVGGQGFDKMIEKKEPLSQSTVMQVGLDIAEGLQAADEIGLIHGDIKPENILLDEKDSAKLIDFGIASYAQKGSEDGIWGTPYYIAPEKIRRQKVDARSDIYCLGGTLYHALTGKPPFDGETPVDVVKARLTNDPVPPSETRPKIHPSVESIVMRMLQREPSRRYPNYGSLISDLRKAISTVGGRKGPRATIKKGRKVIVTKKRSGSSTGIIPPPTSTNRAVSKKKYKSKNSKKKHKPSSPDAETSSAVAKHLEHRKAEQDKNPKKGGSKKTLIIFLILVVLGGALGGTFYLMDKSKKKKAAKIAAYNHEVCKKEATDIYKKIKETAKNVEKLADSAKAVAGTVSNSVFVVLNESLEYQLEPKPKKKPKKDKKKKKKKTGDLVSPEDQKADKKKSDEKKPDADKADAPAEEAKPEEKPPAPEKPLSTEEYRQKLAIAEGRVAAPKPEPKAEEPAAEDGESDAPAIDTVEAGTGDPEIKKFAISTIKQVQELLNSVFKARYTVKESKALLEKIEKSASLDSAKTPFKELKVKQGLIKEQYQAIKMKLKKVEESTLDVARLEKEEMNRREAQKRAEEEAVRLAKERDEQEQRDQDLAELIEKETQSIKAMAEANKPLIMEYKYKAILDEVIPLKADYTTKEGKKLYEMMYKRYLYLYRFKKFLTQHLNDFPFKWGWGKGLSAIDIQGASEDGIRVRSKTVPWENVKLPQMMRIIQHYADRNTYRRKSGAPKQQFTMPKLSADPKEPAIRVTKVRLLGEQNLAAAIFCFETGGEKGLELAKTFAREAASLCADLEEKSFAIIPELE